MPFTRISMHQGKSPNYVKAVSDSLHQALVDAFEVPADDRFQVIHQLAPGELVFDPHYMGGPRSTDFILFQVNAGRLRSAEVRKPSTGVWWTCWGKGPVSVQRMSW